MVLYYGIIGEYHDNSDRISDQPAIYRHVKMGRWQGAISAAHVRQAMAMYTMCDVRLWDGDGGGERVRKRSGGGGPRDCHGADSGRPIRIRHLGTLNQVDPDRGSSMKK